MNPFYKDMNKIFSEIMISTDYFTFTSPIKSGNTKQIISNREEN